MQEFVRRGYVDPDAEQSFFFRDSHFKLAIQEERLDIALYLWKNGLQGRNSSPAQIQKLFIDRHLLCKVKRPEEMLRFLDKIGMAHIVATETAENGTFTPLKAFIRKYRLYTNAIMFVSLARRGLIDPYMLREIMSFQYVEYRDYRVLKEALLVECHSFENFKQGFLPLTVKVVPEGMPKRRATNAKTLLEAFDAEINRIVADFVGVPYGKVLTNINLMMIMITVHLHS